MTLILCDFYNECKKRVLGNPEEFVTYCKSGIGYMSLWFVHTLRNKNINTAETCVQHV